MVRVSGLGFGYAFSVSAAFLTVWCGPGLFRASPSRRCKTLSDACVDAQGSRPVCPRFKIARLSPQTSHC